MDLMQLPLDWTAAISAFRQGKNVPDIFSEQLQSMFADCKAQEQRRFARHVTDFEYHSYLEVV